MLDSESDGDANASDVQVVETNQTTPAEDEHEDKDLKAYDEEAERRQDKQEKEPQPVRRPSLMPPPPGPTRSLALR